MSGNKKSGRPRGRAGALAAQGGVLAVAERLGLSRQAVHKRLSQGMSPEAAATAPRRNRRRRWLRSTWAPWGGIAAAAKLAGVSPAALSWRVAELRMSPAQAVAAPRARAARVPQAPGAKHWQLTVLEDLGHELLCQCVCGALTKPERARVLRGHVRSCGAGACSAHKRQPRTWAPWGGLKAIAKQLGVHRTTLMARVRAGMTREAAIALGTARGRPGSVHDTTRSAA